MINKYFEDEEIQENDLLFICFMIEKIARNIHQKNKYVVNTIGKDSLYHLISLANVLHCENFDKLTKDWINEYQLKRGSFDIKKVNPSLCSIIPTCMDMAKVYSRLVVDTKLPNEDFVSGIIRVYNNPICEVIDNYNNGAFYEPSYVKARAYKEGEF